MSQVTTVGTIGRKKKREDKIVYEMDSYAAKINRILADDPLVEHLMPINPGGDDLADKLKDGLLLTAFINRIPGFGELINIKRLHRVKRDADGNWEKLNMFQVAQNQDMMLQAARFIGLNVDNVGVMDLIEGRKHKHLVVKLLQEIMTFDGMERLADAAQKLDSAVIEAETRGASGSVSLSRDRGASLRNLSVKGRPGQKRDDAALLRKFLNETLEEASCEEKVNPELSLSEALSDSVIYLRILNYLDPKQCTLDSLSEEDPLDRANAVIENLGKVGLAKDYQNYDIVYGEDDIHIQIVASIATLAATIRLAQLKPALEEVKDITPKSEEVKQPVTDKPKVVEPVFVQDTPKEVTKVEPQPRPEPVSQKVESVPAAVIVAVQDEEKSPDPAASPKVRNKLPSIFEKDPPKDVNKSEGDIPAIDVGGTADERILKPVLDAARADAQKPLGNSDEDMIVIEPKIAARPLKTESDREESKSQKVYITQGNPEPMQQPVVTVVPIVAAVESPKEEPKAEVKIVITPEVKVDQKPEARVEVKESKQELSPEVKIEIKQEKKNDKEPSQSHDYNKPIPKPDELVTAKETEEIDEGNENQSSVLVTGQPSDQYSPSTGAGDVSARPPGPPRGGGGGTDDRKHVDKNQMRWCIFAIFFFAVLFLILGSVATTVANNKISEFITNYAPIRSSTGTASQFKSRSQTRSFYVFNYKNVGSFNGANMQVEQVGPIQFTENIYAYNTSFKKTSFLSPSKYVLQYMERSQLTLQNADSWKSFYVTVPSMYYIGAVSSDYFNNLLSYVPTAVSQTQAYYNSTVSSTLSQMLVPVYMSYVERTCSNPDLLKSSWASSAAVNLSDGHVFPALQSPITIVAVNYLFDRTQMFSIFKRTVVASDGGVLAWMNSQKSFDYAIIVDLMKQAGLSNSSATLTLFLVRDWLSSLVDSSDYLFGVKSQLQWDVNVSMPATEAGNISTISDLGIYQFASGNLISYLSSGNNKSVVDLTSTFVGNPLYEPYEIAVFFNKYSSTLKGLTVSQAKQFLSIFSDANYVGSFLSTVSYGSFASFSGTYLSNITASGVSSSNSEAVSAFLKHLGKMYYFYSNNLGISREFPPTSIKGKGLFIRISVYDLLMGYVDPNLVSSVSQISTYPNPIVSSYSTDAAHWSAHKGEWNQIQTGADGTASVYKGVEVKGLTAIRGVWTSKEFVTANLGNVNIEPFHKNSPVSSFTKWDDKLARSVSYSSSGTSSKYNVFTVYRYKPSDSLYQNQTVNAANAKYYMNGPSGVASMVNYYRGGDFWISKPHFLSGDSSLSSSFAKGSFTPSDSSHNSYFDVESWSGSISGGSQRSQVNVRLKKKDWITEPGYTSYFASRSSDLYLPVFWVDESFQMSSTRYTDLYNNIYKWQQGALAFTIVFLIVGIILFCVELWQIYNWTKIEPAEGGRISSLKGLFCCLRKN